MHANMEQKQREEVKNNNIKMILPSGFGYDHLCAHFVKLHP